MMNYKYPPIGVLISIFLFLVNLELEDYVYMTLKVIIVYSALTLMLTRHMFALQHLTAMI